MLVDHALRRARRSRRVHDHHAVVGGDVVLDRVEHRVGHRRPRSASSAAKPRRATRWRRNGAATGRGAVADGGRRPRRARRRSRCRGTPARRAARSTSARASRSRSSVERGERADRHGDRADAGRRQPRERRSRCRSGRAARSGCRARRPAASSPRASTRLRCFGVGVGEAVVVAHDVVERRDARATWRAQHPADGRSARAHGRRGRHGRERAAVALGRASMSASHSTSSSRSSSACDRMRPPSTTRSARARRAA